MKIGLSDVAMTTDVLQRARTADELGFHHLYLADQGSRSHDQWVTLGAISQLTQHLRLGLITNPYTRRPEVTANALRALSELTDGRAFLCLAKGGQLAVRDMGTRRERPVAVMADALEIIRQQNPDAELWVATKGPKMVDMALRHADGILLSGVPLSFLPQLVADLRRIAPAEFKIGFTVTHVHDEQTLDHARRRLAGEMMAMREDIRQAAGISPDLIEQVRATLLQGPGHDAAAKLISAELASQFTLTGPVDELPERLRELEVAVQLDVLDIPAKSGLAGGNGLMGRDQSHQQRQ